MTNKRTLFFILVSLLLPMQGSRAQIFSQHTIDLWNKLTGPSKVLDPEYFLQRSPRWTLSPKYTFISTGLSMDCDIEGVAENQKVGASLSMKFDSRSSNQLGLTAGWGPLSFGLGKELGKKNADKNNFIRLFSAGYGIQVRYSKHYEKISGNLSFTQVVEMEPMDFTTEYPGRMKFFSVDGYYVLNRRRFSYIAAYDSKTLQKKSSGSVVFVSKYSSGEMSFDPHDEVFVMLLDDTGSIATRQLSIGAGYSYNRVILHRDPSEKDKGLRNLTLNLTATPMLTFLNRVIFRTYGYPDWNYVKEEYLRKHGLDEYYALRDYIEVREMYLTGCEISGQSKIKGAVQPNLILRAGALFTYDRWNVNLYGEYNMFRIKSDQVPMNPERHEKGTALKMDTVGLFHDWIAGLKVGYRF